MFADDTTIPLPALYIEAADPTTTYIDGRSFAKRMWLDTSTGATGTLKKRNAADTGWDTLINLDAPVVADDAVTNAKLANMAQATIKGRASGAGTGDPTDLTATQATAILNTVVGDSGSGGTKGLVPAPGAGDAAAGKFLKADGSFAVPPSSSGDVVGPSSATDNAIARFDSTTGKLIQNSVVIVSDAGAITVPEISAPSTPASGTVHIYAKSDGHLYIKDDAGTETDLTTGGGGSIAPLVIDSANQVSQRNSTNIQTFRVYATDDGAGNARWIQIAEDGSTHAEILSTGSGGGGVATMRLRVAGGGNGVELSTAQLSPVSDRGLSLGNGSNRWDQITCFSLVVNGGAIAVQNAGTLHSVADGIWVPRNSGGGAATGTFAFGEATQSQITTNQNNYDLGNPGHFQRLSSDASRDITGIRTSVSGNNSGQVHLLVNVGSNPIVLKHQDTNSTSTNRLLCSTGADITLNADQAAEIIYDLTSQRWRVFKRN